MGRKIQSIILAAAVLLGSAFVSLPVAAAGCTGVSDTNCNKICSGSLDAAQKQAAGCDTGSGKEDQLPAHIETIINVVISIIGILAVIVIVMGGQRYISSSGDPVKIKQAKDMILYAVIAIVVALLAYAIVSFITKNIVSDTNLAATIPLITL